METKLICIQCGQFADACDCESEEATTVWERDPEFDAIVAERSAAYVEHQMAMDSALTGHTCSDFWVDPQGPSD